MTSKFDVIHSKTVTQLSSFKVIDTTCLYVVIGLLLLVCEGTVAATAIPIMFDAERCQVIAPGDRSLTKIVYIARKTDSDTPAIQQKITQGHKDEDSPGTWSYPCSGSMGSDTSTELSARNEADQLTLTYRLQSTTPVDTLRGRLVLYANDHLDFPLQVQRPRRITPKTRGLTIKYGPWELAIILPPESIQSISNWRERVYINLSDAGQEALTTDGLPVTFKLTNHFQKNTMQALDEAADQLQDCEAILSAIRLWNLSFVDSSAFAELDEKHKQLNASLKNLRQQVGKIDNIEQQTAWWSGMQKFKAQVVQLAEDFNTLLLDHREEIYMTVKQFNQNLPYRVGLSIDTGPDDQLPSMVLFDATLMRISAGMKIWAWVGKHRFNDDEFINLYMKTMSELERIDVKVIASVPHGAPETRDMEDFTFTHELLPVSRANLNGRSRRLLARQTLARWAQLTRDFDNIVVYQIGNEPFWSTRPSPIYGYDMPTVGCSNETFREQIKAYYGTLEQWWDHVDEPTGRRAKMVMGNQSLREIFSPWKTLDDVRYDPQRCRGLTFVQFLKNRYQTLEALNRAWFASDTQRYFTSWDRVFPPLPKAEARVSNQDTGDVSAEHYDIPANWVIIDNTAAPFPEPDDIPAWMDWAAFWAYNTSDSLRDQAEGMREGNPIAPVSTNCVTGHMINGFNHNAADTGMNPWVTPNGLDAVGIDFYSMGYFQSYVRAVISGANGRPTYIHETELVSADRGMYVTMYGLAYGIDGISFWRRDHRVPPRMGIGLLKASLAVGDPDLQNHTQPVTDGVALLYSLPSMYLSDAMTGGPNAYLRSFQGAALMLERLQTLYDIYEDSQLVDGIPTETKVLYVPNATSISDRTWQAMRRYVQGGGHIVATARSGTYNEHGRPRPEAERAWLNDNQHVLLLDENAHVTWRDLCNSRDHTPQLWRGRSLPSWAGKVNTFIERHAPRTVRYVDMKSGQLGENAPGVRKGEDMLFVFVDPWASPTRLEIKGIYDKAFERYTNQPLTVLHHNDHTIVELKNGPAVVRLDKIHR